METLDPDASETKVDWHNQEQFSVKRSSLWLFCFLIQATAPMVALHFAGSMFLKDAEERGFATYKISPAPGGDRCEGLLRCSAGTRSFCTQRCDDDHPICQTWPLDLTSAQLPASYLDGLDRISTPQLMLMAELCCILASWVPLTVQILFPWVRFSTLLLNVGGLVLAAISIDAERRVYEAASTIHRELGGELVRGCVRRGVMALGISHAVCTVTAVLFLWLAR